MRRRQCSALARIFGTSLAAGIKTLQTRHSACGNARFEASAPLAAIGADMRFMVPAEQYRHGAVRTGQDRPGAAGADGKLITW
jgi:hypothetical protein